MTLETDTLEQELEENRLEIQGLNARNADITKQLIKAFHGIEVGDIITYIGMNFIIQQIEPSHEIWRAQDQFRKPTIYGYMNRGDRGTDHCKTNKWVKV